MDIEKRQKLTWIIDWRIEGSIEIAAASADEAQEIFDKRFGSPSFLKPDRDGEVSNDKPYRKGRDNGH